MRWVAAGCLLVAAYGLASTAGIPNAVAEEPALEIVSTVQSDDQLSLVVDLGTTASVSADDFSVRGGGEELPTDAVPVLSDRAAVGLIVDAAADSQDTVQAGLNGAANLLLQLPTAAHVAAVADTDPPEVLAPLAAGLAETLQAISAVEPAGERATVRAVSLLIDELAGAPAGPRTVVVYTGGADLDPAAAPDLTQRLHDSRAILAVVTTESDPRTWSQVARATGGVLVTTSPTTVLTAFDEAADALRRRYVLDVEPPAETPDELQVQVTAEGRTLSAGVDLARGPDSESRGGTDRPAPAPDRTDSDESSSTSTQSIIVLAIIIGTAAVITVWELMLLLRKAGIMSNERKVRRLLGRLRLRKSVPPVAALMDALHEVEAHRREQPTEGPAEPADGSTLPAEGPAAPPSGPVSSRPAKVTSSTTQSPGPAVAHSIASNRPQRETRAVADAEQRARDIGAAVRAAAQAVAAPHRTSRPADPPTPGSTDNGVGG